MTARSLILRHMAKMLAAEEPKPDAIKPNHMQLYSFYHPGLEAGDYEVFARQDICAQTSSGEQTLTVINTKKGSNASNKIPEPQIFEVVKPQFSLDRAPINSYYPPNGHQDEGRVMPHIVLSDPHFPWERAAGLTSNMYGEIDEDSGDNNVKRNMVPWVALMVFDIGDLVVPDVETAKTLKIPGFTSADDVSKQNSTGTFSMKVSEYMSIPDGSRIRLENGLTGDSAGLARLKGSSEMMQVIFPLKTHVKERFSDLEAFKYLAHVRHVNTVGFPDAGDEEEGLFSIVISPRTGAFDIQQPTTQIVHLVSIEHLDYTLKEMTSSVKTDRLGMISLFSWVYTALPPDPVNFVDTMLNLAQGMQMLRPKANVLDNLLRKAKEDQADSGAAALLHQRFSLGYTLSRWRAETGEETAAFYRGPFIPQPVRQPPDAQWKDCSNNSKDYQILDPSTGLADLSYSSAWQLGKLLAISDSVFCAALMRFRSRVHESSASQTLMEVNGVQTAATIMRELVSSTKKLERLTHDHIPITERFRLPTGPSYRRPAPPIGIDHHSAVPIFKSKVFEQVSNLANAGEEIYNEFNVAKPNDSDWVAIHGWVMDKLYLAGIPAHYLVPDPSFLPPEGLRFFYIDDNWLDCLLDGALSVANHLDKDDDFVRRVIKHNINKYLSTEIQNTGVLPQVPKYGFMLRSKIIKAMPDLRITLRWKKPDKRQTVCRYTRWDETTILCLLDRYPEEIEDLVLAQPSHQQRFSLGYSLTSNLLEFRLIKLYTANPPDGAWQESGHNPKFGPNGPIKDDQNTTDTGGGGESDSDDCDHWGRDTEIGIKVTRDIYAAVPSSNDSSSGNNWFNWSTRCANTRIMAEEINQLCQVDGEYNDKVPTSPPLALQLNDPTHYLRVVPPAGTTIPAASTQIRSLYIARLDLGKSEIMSSDPPPTFPEYEPVDSNPYIEITGAVRAESAKYIPVQLTAPSRPVPRACVVSKSPRAIGVSRHSVIKMGIYPSSDEEFSLGSDHDNGSAGAASGDEQSNDNQKDTDQKESDQKGDSGSTDQKSSNEQDDSNDKKEQQTSPTPQFLLSVFPDYRSAPASSTDDDDDPTDSMPRSRPVPTAGASEYIPTQNKYFFDLIFAVQRIDAPTAGLKMKELRIEIPQRRATTVEDTDLIEPLLTPTYTGPGVRMVANQRLVSFISTRLGALTDTFIINMVPRSASDSATLDVDGGRLVEASVRLAEANVDEKVRVPRKVKIRGKHGETACRGVVSVDLVETYTTGSARSSWNVFKKNTRDFLYDGKLRIDDDDDNDDRT
ncbi:hypothetical protein F5Y19DRAFT_394874 [Xylariaceae sp. FL1651]|nr:hypothetical protein F5Y19DRAFT_394874 [Xylariaceae sp. FL1651]